MKRWVAVLLFLVACDAPTRPSVYVPESWKEYRKGVGHLVHLEAEDIACADCHPAEGSGFASPGDLICERCHEDVLDRTHVSAEAPKSKCLECHGFKEVTEVAPDACARCHEDAEVHTDKCTSCHQPHGTKPRARCETCHEEVSSPLHVTIRDPIERCEACHEPHGDVRSCASCHEDKKAAPGHEGCSDCHVAHDEPKTCASCHTKQSDLGHEKCSDCHDPHRESKPLDACATCHTDVLVNHADKNACADCHAGHTKPTLTCTKCHENAPSDRALHASKTDCKSCHQPHGMQPLDCSRCHATVLPIAPHQDCASCHDTAHAPKKDDAACATCHEVGGHEECGDCHEPHTGRAAKKDCASCHDKVTAHGKKACATCHDQHAKIEPPACVSCHEALPALHGDPGHRDCSGCHKAHGPRPVSDRRTCGRCHEGLEKHEPAASSCRGCHPFTTAAVPR